MCPKAVIFVAQSEEEGKVSNLLFKEIVPALSLTLIGIVVRYQQGFAQNVSMTLCVNI